MVSTPTVLLEGDARAAWLAERRTGIGSSDAPTLVGLNPYSSALTVYLQKTGELPEEPENEAMHWGNVLEGPVAEEFANRNGFDIYVPHVPDGAISGARVAEAWPWMRANIDRFVAEPGSDTYIGHLECKTGGPHVARDWGDEPPAHVIVQVQHQLAVTGGPRAWVAVLIAGQHYRDYLVERDDEMIAGLVDIEAEFWDRVERRDPPPPDGTSAAADALLEMYDFEKESVVELEPEARALIDAYRRTKAEIKELEERERRESNAIKALLGTHHIGTIEGEKAVSWPRWKQQQINREALEADHPDLVAAYLVDSTRGRLVLHRPKAAA